MRALALTVSLATLLCCQHPTDVLDAGEPMDAGSFDAGLTDAGAPDAGTPDAGTPDAGARDAGPLDSGVADGGAGDAGTPDAGGPRALGAVPTVAADASMPFSDAGYTPVVLLGRATLPTTLAATLDGGFVVAVSPQSVVVAEGPQCELSFINRYSCDYRWIAPSGATLATVPNASGLPNARGEVMMLFRDYRVDCVDPIFASLVLSSAAQSLMDVETGAVRLSWPRDSSSTDVGEKGDLVADPRGGRLCDGGAPFIPVNATFNRVRAPYEKLFGVSAYELGAQRVLLIDAGHEVSVVEADAGRSTLAPRGPPASADVHLDTFTLRRGDGYYRGSIDGGALKPLVTLATGQLMNAQGGRFASVTQPPDYASRVVIDSEGRMPDLRYPVGGELLERAPLLFGRGAGTKLVVGWLDQGTASTSPFDVSSGMLIARFPHDDAAIVVDTQQVAWLLDQGGLTRLTDQVVKLPYRSFEAPYGAPNVLLLVRRQMTGAPLELVAVDRPTRRLVTLSQQAYVNLSPGYLGGCDVPGLLTPGAKFIYFAETTSVAGQINLYLVPSDLSQVPRQVGTTAATPTCRVPVVSRDGTRVAVQENLGGPPTVKVGTW